MDICAHGNAESEFFNRRVETLLDNLLQILGQDMT
jgi:hypothetical protein